VAGSGIPDAADDSADPLNLNGGARRWVDSVRYRAQCGMVLSSRNEWVECCGRECMDWYRKGEYIQHREGAPRLDAIPEDA
jgi:hypothetical protein